VRGREEHEREQSSGEDVTCATRRAQEGNDGIESGRGTEAGRNGGHAGAFSGEQEQGRE
jgi:hypothetical protein